MAKSESGLLGLPNETSYGLQIRLRLNGAATIIVGFGAKPITRSMINKFAAALT